MSKPTTDSGEVQIKAATARYAGLRNRGHSAKDALERITSDPNYSWIGDEELAEAIVQGEKNHELTLRVREQNKHLIIGDEQ